MQTEQSYVPAEHLPTLSVESIFRALEDFVDNRLSQGPRREIWRAMLRKAAMELAHETTRGEAAIELRELSDRIEDREYLPV